MVENPAADPPTHAELAASIPDPPPDAENDAILFARKTFRVTAVLSALFIGAAVVYTFVMQ